MVAKVYGPTFSSKYILRDTLTVEDEQAFDVEAREQDNRSTIAFNHGGEDEDKEEEEPESP